MNIKKLIVIPTALALTAVFGFGAFGFSPVANAQTVGPRVGIQLLNTGLTSPLEESDEDATVARLVLDTTGSSEQIRITSLPFILNTGNGAVASDLENCQVSNESNIDAELNSDDTLQSGLNNISLSSPLILNANTINTFSLRCDVSDDMVAGGTYTFSMNTANLVATGASTGLPAFVYVRGAVVVPPPVVVPPVTPGLPTTGAGGEAAQNIAIIMGSMMAAITGLALMRKAEKRA